MVHLVGATEREAEKPCGLHSGYGKAWEPGGSCEFGTCPLVHDDWVVQGTADGYIAVICHSGQEEALSYPEEEGEIHLDGTAEEGDGCFLVKQSPQHFRHNGQVETNLHEGQVPEEEVHGTAQHGVCHSKQDDKAVSHQCDQVDDQKCEEEQ